MAIADTIDKISQLLWAQKLNEARELLQSAYKAARSRVTHQEIELMEARADLKRIESLLPPDMKPGLGFKPNLHRATAAAIAATTGLGPRDQISELAKTLPSATAGLEAALKSVTDQKSQMLDSLSEQQRVAVERAAKSLAEQHTLMVDSITNTQLLGALTDYPNYDGAADKLTPAQREERRKSVIDCAKWLAPNLGSTVEVSQIASQLASHNIEMGVPANRVSTTISTILTRTEEFDNIGTGLYKRVKISKQGN